MNWCIHTPSSDIQQGWYAGINYTSPLGITGSLSTRLFIYGAIQCCVRQSELVYQYRRLFLFIPASETFLVYTSVIGMFIKYTSAPVEVSVWLGGKLLKSVYGAFCVQDAVQVE